MQYKSHPIRIHQAFGSNDVNPKTPLSVIEVKNSNLNNCNLLCSGAFQSSTKQQSKNKIDTGSLSPRHCIGKQKIGKQNSKIFADSMSNQRVCLSAADNPHQSIANNPRKGSFKGLNITKKQQSKIVSTYKSTAGSQFQAKIREMDRSQNFTMKAYQGSHNSAVNSPQQIASPRHQHWCLAMFLKGKDNVIQSNKDCLKDQTTHKQAVKNHRSSKSSLNASKVNQQSTLFEGYVSKKSARNTKEQPSGKENHSDSAILKKLIKLGLERNSQSTKPMFISHKNSPQRFQFDKSSKEHKGSKVKMKDQSELSCFLSVRNSLQKSTRGDSKATVKPKNSSSRQSSKFFDTHQPCSARNSYQPQNLKDQSNWDKNKQVSLENTKKNSKRNASIIENMIKDVKPSFCFNVRQSQTPEFFSNYNVQQNKHQELGDSEMNPIRKKVRSSKEGDSLHKKIVKHDNFFAQNSKSGQAKQSYLDSKERKQHFPEHGQPKKHLNSECFNQNSFEYEYVVGRGGFGKVWKVQCKKTKKTFALKQMSKALIISKKSIPSVMNEKQLLSTLSQNPFLVNMKQSFQSRENLFLVMDFLEGGDMRHHLVIKKYFTQEETKFIIVCILLGLKHLHSNGIIHRDIKPENIVLDRKGYARITDLGVARKLRADNSADTSGTPGYMAPEVLCRQNHSYSADYFAVGVIAYELMLRKRPYQGKSRKEIRDQVLTTQVQVKKSQIPESWSLEGADFINRLIQRKPSNRLGYNGFEQILRHPWIRSFPFLALEAKRLVAPYIPKVSYWLIQKQISSTNYDLTSQEDTEVQNLLRQNEIILRKNETQKLFEGYDYFPNQRTTSGGNNEKLIL